MGAGGPMKGPPVSRVAVAVIAVTGLGAALRFLDLGAQGFWYDEAYSAYFFRLPPLVMFRLIPKVESTPPLYYAVGWVWARAFGTSEAGLRALSALVGTAVVPVAYLIGRRLVSVRAGVLAALLTACSPLLVWYSQEARAYSLLVLLTALALLAFLHALDRPTRVTLAAWAAASALALATHYLAMIAVIPEAAWLLIRHRRRLAAWGAAAAVAVTGCALLPLALTQDETLHTAWIARIPLDRRLGQLGDQFVSGFAGYPLLTAVAGAGAGVEILLLLRAGPRERRGALGMAVLGTSGLALALALVALGSDDLITRNVIAAWLPLALAVAIGLSGRVPPLPAVAAALAVCGVGVVATMLVDSRAGLQRPDWRRVVRALGAAHGERLVALENYRPEIPLLLYRPDLVRLHGRDKARVSEIDVVAPDTPSGRSCWWGAACNLSRGRAPGAPPGFAIDSEVEIPNFDVYRLRAARSRELRIRRLRGELRYLKTGAVLLERPGARSPDLSMIRGRST